MYFCKDRAHSHVSNSRSRIATNLLHFLYKTSFHDANLHLLEHMAVHWVSVRIATPPQADLPHHPQMQSSAMPHF